MYRYAKSKKNSEKVVKVGGISWTAYGKTGTEFRSDEEFR